MGVPAASDLHHHFEMRRLIKKVFKLKASAERSVGDLPPASGRVPLMHLEKLKKERVCRATKAITEMIPGI